MQINAKINIATLQQIWEQLVPTTDRDRTTAADLATEFSNGFLTTFNVMPDSKTYNMLNKELSEIIREVRALQDNNSFTKVKDGEKVINVTRVNADNSMEKIQKVVPKWQVIENKTKENQPIFSISDPNEATQLFQLMSNKNHPLIDKINSLNCVLEKNKNQTDELYDFLVNAKLENKNQEFTNQEKFEKFLESQNPVLASLRSTEKLMQIANAFIKTDPEPKNFNGFVDTLETRKKNVILEFIQKITDKIYDKIYCLSQAEKIGKNMIKDLHIAVKQSSQNKENKGRSFNI